MATIQLRRSAVANAVPTTTQLALGELAINTYDGKLYLKKDNGTESIVEIGGGSANISIGDNAPSSPSSGALWWDSAQGKLKIYYNDGTSSQWVDASSNTYGSGSAGTGTVTSVGGTGTVSGLTLTGTVTSSGNLTLGGTLSVTPSNFASQIANTFLSAPNGASGTPTFRTIVADDLPDTAVAPGSYTNTNITVDAQGRITAASNGSSGGSASFTNIEVNIGGVSRSGSFTISGAGFTPGKPVFIQQAVGPYTGKGTLADEAEMDQLLVTASVIDSTTIKAYWTSHYPVRGNFKFNYLIGA